ncbi:ATP-binding protein [Azospirillum brasilense]|nr:ATP-binding protein [Azospirillum brasilense]
MKTLARSVTINRRFARSARLDADLQGTPPLVGYVLQASVAKSLTTMAASHLESGQGAFTWTGPYGGGKSSAALLVANLIAGEPTNRKIARKIAGRELTALYDSAFPTTNGNWAVVAVTGSRVELRQSIVDAAASALKWTKAVQGRAAASNEGLIDALSASATEKFVGVVVILDELGKLLEHEAASGGDIHLLQDLAERSSRSDGRLVVIGILHQAFEQYAARVSREARQEWAKVQGRFQDVPFLAGADESVALLAQAITAEGRPDSAHLRAAAVAEAVSRRKPSSTDLLAKTLAETWPLNPVTALLLGPVSRQRFAQNERSVFGFLSSAEPSGFQEFLTAADADSTYGPDRLWDYLVANFGMALTAGSDGNRFSLAFEAIERAAAKGTPTHVRLTKAAAIIEFFRNGSGLAVADDFLREALPDIDVISIDKAVGDLVDWAVLIRQPRLGGYALFAGSDFDLEDAIGRVVAPLSPDQLTSLPPRAGLGFAAAKRHYFRTGALRTFEILLQQLGEDDEVDAVAARLAAHRIKGSGMLILALSDGTLSASEVDSRCKTIARTLKKLNVIAAIGGAGDSFALRSSAAEMFAVERVFREHPQLEGDRIARRELAARQAATSDTLHRELEAALNNARWWIAAGPSLSLKEPLSVVASALADAAYPDAPLLKSELLQRDRPSSSAMAAVRELCHAMVSRGDQVNLGFTGYPAEMGLYLTVLAAFGLHGCGKDGVPGFHAPDDSIEGLSLAPAWAVLAEAEEVRLDQVYETWAKPPFGLKAGVMPVLALAALLAMREQLAVYLDGVFQTGLDDVFVDKLLQRPGEIRIKRVNRDVREQAFLDDLARRFNLSNVITSLPIAQALFQRYESLTPYAQRTDRLSPIAKAVRTVVLRARDPEALLFEGLPAALGDDLNAQLLVDALHEAERAYPALLDELRDALGRALAVDPSNFSGLRERAAAIKDLTNDFAFEGFAMRAAAFEDGNGDIEGISSVLLHKPARSWSDRDREQALVQMARYGQQFRELEALAVVRDRPSNTEALALVVGVDPSTPPLLRSFVLTEDERLAAASLADRVLGALRGEQNLDRVQLAALARAIAMVAAEQEREVA